jgi:hypothetical protein
MENHPDPSLPRAPNGLENRRRLRHEALSRLAAEEQRFAVASLADPAPQPLGTRRRAIRTLAQGVLAFLIATVATSRRLMPVAWAGPDSNSNQDPDKSPGDVYGGPPPDDGPDPDPDSKDDQNNPPEELFPPGAGPGQDPNTKDDPDNSPGQIYGGPPPDDQEDQNGSPQDEPPPANMSPLQQPVQPSPPAPVYGGPPPGASN